MGKIARLGSIMFVLVLINAFSCTASDQAVSAKNLTYITEQFPPFNFKEDGKLQGISVDLLEIAWQRMGEDLNRSVIRLLSWTDGYKETLEKNNTVLFAVGRSPEREDLFKWAGPIGSSWYVLLTKMEKNISITTPKDIKKLKIGAIEDDLAIQMLLDKGVEKDDIIIETTSEAIIEKLKNGSIDAWAYNDLTAIWQLQKSGINVSDYVVSYVLGGADAYLAFNKEVPDSLVQSFQESIDYIMAKEDEDGKSSFERIQAKYIPGIYEL
jgi:polar amino acid transport system substrate-binding protein